MRRTTPVEPFKPIEPAAPLSHASGANPEIYIPLSFFSRRHYVI